MALTKEQIQQIAAQTRSSFESGSFAPTGVQCLFDDVHDAIDTAIRAQHQQSCCDQPDGRKQKYRSAGSNHC